MPEPIAQSGSETSIGRSFLIDDAAQLLGVSRRTVYYRIREGRLRTIRTKCGSQRVLLSSIEALLRGKECVGRRVDGTDPAESGDLQAEPLTF